MRTCKLCDYTIPEDKHRCPSCNAWNMGADDAAIGNDGSLLFEDIDEKAIERIPTGLLDECLDGGVVRSDVILIGGLPGGGKSTLMLQLAARFCALGTVLYISAEEDIRAIKLRGQRLGVQTKRRLRLVPALSGVANIGALLMHYRPALIIIDSIDSLSNQDNDAEISLLKALKAVCVELNAPAFVVSRINKAGDYSGLMDKKHEVDVLMTIELTDFEGETNGEPLRVAETQKNRSGRAYVRSYFEMTGKGLVCTLDPTVSEGDSGSEEYDSGPESYS